ncbi:anion exchange protein 3 isoform X2 [Chrysoperla carnea]|uniref:anion exchange protein 3 isoform X2 n=1 Tax=Chrysoperla carnea TaxID=189513 RepID=UPI001D097D08|nr:anion exchange protein 3 isoform X2 [Chrysoperla carnea]
MNHGNFSFEQNKFVCTLKTIPENENGSHGGGSGTEVRLDEEMEKVFAMSGGIHDDKFDVSILTSGNEPPDHSHQATGTQNGDGSIDGTNGIPQTTTSAAARQYTEREYSFHRKKSYPHMHAPLKAIHSRSMKRRITSPQLSESEQSVQDSPSFNLQQHSQQQQSLLSFSTTDGGVGGDGITSSPPISVITPILTSPDGGGTSSETATNVPEDEIFSSGSEVLQIGSDSPVLGSPPDKRVQFITGCISDIPEHSDDNGVGNGKVDDGPTGRKNRRKSRHHHSSYHHRFRKYSLQEDPESRKRSGSSGGDRENNRRVSIQPEDATLQEADIDDLTSHRSDDARGLRRHKIPQKIPSTVHIGRRENVGPLHHVLPIQTLRKIYDHSPHSVFVQLDELQGDGEEREWKETARWIKYEEDVEEGADRWGRPHVASLSFHSLLNLRRCLETGVVLLDMEEKDLPGVAYRVVEQMVTDELIQESDKPIVMRALLLRHRHVNEHERGFRFGKRHYSSYTSLQSLWLEDGSMGCGERSPHGGRCSVCSQLGRRSPTTGIQRTQRRFSAYSLHGAHNLSDNDKRKASLLNFDDRRKTSLVNMEAMSRNGSMVHTDPDGRLVVPDNHIIVDMKEETYASSNEDLKKAQNDAILKRIPVGSEATTVLVGSVDFLEQPTIAFVRLAEGILMPSITEVNIPVRFLFILLGPSTADLDYHEIGRSISTLMANPSFHKIAYKADDRKALLSAINEFLDDSIVLPPGDWEQKALLPFDELKAKSEAIRKRKQKALQKGSNDEATKALISSDDGDGKKPPFFDPLKRTRRPFGGLINDLRRRYPFYVSDITDGLNGQCIAAAIFMYFAALSGAITFGGLMSDKTENLIGISETLVATAMSGVFMALLAGQPLVIVGTTGPLLLFDESLYQFCLASGIEFLTMRVYIGLWIGIIAILVASVEGSVLVKLFTRFTEEIFSALISLIYIMESFMKLIYVYGQHPLLANYCGISDYFLASMLNNSNTTNTTPTYDLNDTMLMDAPITVNNQSMVSEKIQQIVPVNDIDSLPVNQPNTALFCTILALGTFTIAYYLRLFRNSQFLGRSARRALGDFGVPIAIVIMVSLDYFIPQTYTEKLRVPEGLSPSNPEVRGWIISPGGYEHPIQLWLCFAAGVPALLVYILVFMETHISELIIDKKERKLKKGSGFHLDIVLVCMMNAVCGIIGGPWLSAATVRSVSHVSALTVMSRTHAPGEKPHIVEVKEQRLSAFIVAVLIGVSVLMSPLLRLVPMSVLFGVFLYMGVSSTNGIQFFERMQLFFMPVKHHPNAAYVRRVPTYKIHLFTFIQLLCLAMLWIVKSTKASLAFPFFLLLMLPLRAQMKHMFTERELRALDGDQADDGDTDEPDFYAEAPLPG